MIMRRNTCHDTDNPAGQVNMTNKNVDPNFEFARAQYENNLDLQNAMVYKRLSEVIDKMAREEALFDKGVPRKKISFEEWMNQRFPEGFENYEGNLGFSDLSACWRAAQDNA